MIKIKDYININYKYLYWNYDSNFYKYNIRSIYIFGKNKINSWKKANFEYLEHILQFLKLY